MKRTERRHSSHQHIRENNENFKEKTGKELVAFNSLPLEDTEVKVQSL